MAKLQAGSSSITDGDRENPPQLPTLPLLQHQIFPSLILVVINTQRNAKLEERLTFWHSIWAYSTISLVPSGQRFGYAGFRQRRARRSWDPITTFHQEGNTNPSIFFFSSQKSQSKIQTWVRIILLGFVVKENWAVERGWGDVPGILGGSATSSRAAGSAIPPLPTGATFLDPWEGIKQVKVPPQPLVCSRLVQPVLRCWCTFPQSRWAPKLDSVPNLRLSQTVNRGKARICCSWF